MKKTLSAMFLSLLFTATTANAQTLSEGFEGDTTPPEGWTVRSSCTQWSWSSVKYSTFSNFVKGYNDGGLKAMKSTTGRTGGAVYAPDSWLITPQVSVNEGEFLNFMIGWNASFNATASVPDSARTQFEVLVSTTDTATTSFTDTLYAVVPVDLCNWHAMSLNLAKYAGKQIYIAFHDHGNTPSTPWTNNALYIDDVKVSASNPSDLILESIDSPVDGYYDTQNMTVKVKNYGKEVSSFSVGYSVDGGEAVTETVNKPLGTDSCLTVTFADSLKLSREKHTILAWATAESDILHSNDTLSTTVTIDPTMPFPYKMAEDRNDSLWTSTYKQKILSMLYGWAYSDSQCAWGYIEAPGKNSRLRSNWVEMPGGLTQLKFDYISLKDADLVVTARTPQGDTAAVYNAALLAAGDYAKASVPMDLIAGVYRLEIGIASGYEGQFVLKNLEVKSVEANDIAVNGIVEPAAGVVTGATVHFTAEIENAGSAAQKNVPVKLVYDGETVATETIDSTLAGGDKITYTFNYTCEATKGVHNVSVIAALDGDTNAANDTVSRPFYAYDAMTYPYVENFEDSTQSSLWMRTTGNSSLDWTIGSVNRGYVNYAKDGDNAAYVNSLANTEHDDWLISPAINVTKAGANRLSFYYTTTMKSTNATDKTVLKAYVSKNFSADGFAEADLLSTDTITNSNILSYRQGYAYKEIDEPGIYYIAFQYTGTGHDLLIDDVRFDDATDLAVASVSHTANSGFALTTDTVSVNVINHGASEMKDFDLKYYVNDKLAATEEYDGDALKPGETLEYTFDKKLDISQPGEYVIKVEVSAESDTLVYNNSWTLDAIQNYAVATLPYSESLDSLANLERWTVEGNWQKGNNFTSANSAYNGTGAIMHNAQIADANGDWAFSDCIEIPAGTHELSFFYRTALNGKSASVYAQNFEVYLGSKADSASMTKLLYTSPADVMVPERRYKKVIAKFDNEEGLYYIGIKCTTTTKYGKLFMDQFAIDDTVSTSNTLGEYDADFSEWYQYDPSSQFQHWTVDSDDENVYTTQRVIYNALTASELPGVLVSPAFIGKSGDNIDATLTYSMAISNESQLSDTEKAKMKMSVVLAQVNIPDSFTIVILSDSVITGEETEATGSYTLPADGIYYYGVKAEGADNSIKEDVVATYKLYGLKLVGPETVTAISTAKTSDAAAVEVYTIDGISLGRFNTVDEARKSIGKSGLYIMKSGSTTVKTVIRK